MSEVGTKTLMGALIIVLGILVLFLGLRVMTLSDRLDETEDLRVYSEDMLYEATGYDCKNPTGKVSITLDCLYDALSYEEFDETDFDNFYSADYDGVGGEGFIILKNDGVSSFTSENFRLYLNTELMDSACSVPGDIRSGFTCRLDFSRRCEPGDVLEVRYVDGEDERQVHLRTCD